MEKYTYLILVVKGIKWDNEGQYLAHSRNQSILPPFLLCVKRSANWAWKLLPYKGSQTNSSNILPWTMLKSKSTKWIHLLFFKVHNHVLNAGNSYRAFPPLVGLKRDQLKTLNIQYPERDHLSPIPKPESWVPIIKAKSKDTNGPTMVIFPVPFKCISTEPIQFLQSQFCLTNDDYTTQICKDSYSRMIVLFPVSH